MIFSCLCICMFTLGTNNYFPVGQGALICPHSAVPLLGQSCSLCCSLWECQQCPHSIAGWHHFTGTRYCPEKAQIGFRIPLCLSSISVVKPTLSCRSTETLILGHLQSSASCLNATNFHKPLFSLDNPWQADMKSQMCHSRGDFQCFTWTVSTSSSSNACARCFYIIQIMGDMRGCVQKYTHLLSCLQASRGTNSWAESKFRWALLQCLFNWHSHYLQRILANHLHQNPLQ